MPRSFLNTLTTALCGLSLSTSALAFSPGFPYGNQKVRGVNLGGWLVLEPWITPSLFDNTGNDQIIDEFTFGQFQDRNEALNALRQHWDTWITEQDFADIAAAGLNHVRLPIGYWAFETSRGEPYIDGQLPYLEKAIGWASNHGLKLIVDLHGAPGSQNGFDNSGQKTNNPQWAANSDNVARTNAIIKRIADMVKDNAGNVPIIAPLNEPAGFIGGILDVTRQFWLDSYGNIRFPFGSDRQSDTVVMIHDAFQPLSTWGGFMTFPNFEGVAMDTHIYEMFSQEGNAKSWDQHINDACARGGDLSSFDLWTIVGEWTPAANDCARYLNGRGVGARYDGSFPGSSRIASCSGTTGRASSFSNEYKEFLRKHWEAQTITYEKAVGWIQWTWKAENATSGPTKPDCAMDGFPRTPQTANSLTSVVKLDTDFYC